MLSPAYRPGVAEMGTQRGEKPCGVKRTGPACGVLEKEKGPRMEPLTLVFV